MPDTRLGLPRETVPIRAAEGFTAFRWEQPALFGKEFVGLTPHHVAQVAANTALAELTASIAAMAPEAEGQDITMFAWSVVHGCNSL